jgi:hypothetical protein
MSHPTKITRIVQGTLVLAAVAAVATAAIYGDGLSIEELESLSDGVRNFSLAVMAIVGAWIAFVFPQAIDRYARGRHTDSENSAHVQIAYLRRAFFTSLFVAAASLVSSWTLHFFRAVPSDFGRPFAAAFLTACIAIQLYSLLLIGLPVIEASYDLDRKRALQETEKRLHSVRR